MSKEMPVVAITGTPGTGKSSISGELKRMGHAVVDVAELIRNLEIRTVYDTGYDSHEVDTDMLGRRIGEHLSTAGRELVFLSGHLSHFAPCAIGVVLRTEPHVLYSRLSERGWNEQKVLENVRAEILDVILVEAAERINDVFELDTTRMKADEAAAKVLEAVRRRPKSMRPGRIDWTGGIEEWF